MHVLAGPKLRKPLERFQRVSPGTQRPAIVSLARYRPFAQLAMLLLAIAVIADGFFGRQMAPLNLAGVLPWIHWRMLSLIAIVAIGNLFCLACPFTLVRDIGRKILPANRRWPHALRTKWLPAALILLYLWAYEAFALWDSPWLTAWIIVAYFVAALAIDGVFRGASFCKYVCPIGQFQFVSSLISPREVRVRSQQQCNTCATYDCIRGNERTRGCELYLFQPRKESNLDCTFCLDCVKACPKQNVAILRVVPAATLVNDVYRSSIGRLSHRTDFAALALLIVFGAFVNAAGMTGPVMLWQHRLHARLGPAAMPGIIAAFIVAGAVLLPLLTASGVRLASSKDFVHQFAFALVPIGFAMWLAHLFFHFVTWWGASSSGGWLTSVQILILNGGFLLTLYLLWRIAVSLRLFVYCAVVASGLYIAGIWILFQPMQMRGMM
jgi:polyferredoxin